MTACDPADHHGSLVPADGPRLRISCVYIRDRCQRVFLSTKAGLRFFRMAEALARRGYQVDIVLNRATAPVMLDPRSREVPFKFVRWATIT